MIVIRFEVQEDSQGEAEFKAAGFHENEDGKRSEFALSNVEVQAFVTARGMREYEVTVKIGE